MSQFKKVFFKGLKAFKTLFPNHKINPTIVAIKTKSLVFVVHIYPPVTRQRQTLNIGWFAHFSLQ